MYAREEQYDILLLLPLCILIIYLSSFTKLICYLDYIRLILLSQN